MKSDTITDEYYGLVCAILDDCARHYSTHAMTKSLKQDKVRLQGVVQQRGILVFVDYLPSLEKSLLNSLEEGRACFYGSVLSSPARGAQYPAFLQGLFSRVFSPEGLVLDEVDTCALFFLRQILVVGKKIKTQEKKGSEDETVAKFFNLEYQLADPSSIWDLRGGTDIRQYLRDHGMFQAHCLGHLRERAGERDRSDARCWSGVTGVESGYDFDQAQSVSKWVLELHNYEPEQVASLYNQVCRIISSAIGQPTNWSDLIPRHGTGAVSDHNRSYYKYTLKEWDNHLEDLFPFTEFCMTSGDVLHSTVVDWTEITRTSRLGKVPKTWKGPRLIASEPCSLMFMQQAVSGFIRRRVDSSWIRSFLKLDDQNQNRDLACIGSKTRKLATLDLSEASDRVTCRHVEVLFQNNPELLDLIRTVRSTHVSAKSFGGCTVQLKKFATMGNALTFPVESLVFLSIALTGVLLVRGCRRATEKNIKALLGTVSVYGDDIIVPIDSCIVVKSLLTILGFVINTDKSFEISYFRESCGGDYYDGSDVTPVRGKIDFHSSTGSNVTALVAFSNNLFEKGLWCAADFVKRKIGTLTNVGIPIGHVSSRSVSFKSFCGGRVRARYNRDLCRMQYKRVVLKTPSSVIAHTDSTAPVIQFATENPRELPNWQSGVVAHDEKNSILITMWD